MLSKLEVRFYNVPFFQLPAITPKFDPTTPASAVTNKRLPKPGEVNLLTLCFQRHAPLYFFFQMLVSLKGSPVAVPNTSSVRGIAYSTSGANVVSDS